MMDTYTFADQVESNRDQPSHRPTPEMLADARRRAIAPRSIVSWLAGDPAPGQSALDKRKSA